MIANGTTKLMENDKVVVWESVLEPGESSGMHTHSHDFIIQVIEGAKFSGTYENGEDPFEVEFHSGETYWIEVEDGKMVLNGVSYSATHDVKNIDDKRYRDIAVEIK